MILEQFGSDRPRIIQLWLQPSNAQETKRDLTLRNSLTSVKSQSTKALLFDEEEYYSIGLYAEDSQEGISEGETKHGKILKIIFQIDRDLVAGIKLTPDSSRYLLSYLLDLVNFVFYRKQLFTLIAGLLNYELAHSH